MGGPNRIGDYRCHDPDPETRRAGTRLDDVWGPVARRSGLMAAAVSLLLGGVGFGLLDIAMNRYVLAAFADLLH